ncbi:hypothetical protein SprV_0602062900 [Sparganum proliferum]
METRKFPKRQHQYTMVHAIAPFSSSSSFGDDERDNLSGSRIFTHVDTCYGRTALRSERRWETVAKRESSTYAQLKFLHRCLDEIVLPKCLRYSLPVMTDLCQRTMAEFKKKMIRVLIQDCHSRIRKYRREIEQHFSTCQSIFTEHEMEVLEATVLSSAHCHRRLRDSQLLKKFERISPPTRSLTDGVLVHNFSSRHLTQQQLAVLSYDTKFNTRDARPEDFIASFESALQKCEANEECKNFMRQQVSTLLLRHKPQRAISETEDQELLRIRKMRDIVTLPADKGRSTVVMDKADYTTKLQSLLEDEGAYELSETGEFKKHVNSVNRAIDKLRKAGALKRNEALAAKATDAAMARFYGLPKVHKPGVPLRPIVSLRGTPTFGLSKWLYQRFRFLTEGSEWTVKSAEEFLKSIRDLTIEADEMMVSFDVVSLFMSIPTGLAISTIDELLQEKYDDVEQPLKRTHITELLELCLRTFFTFGDRVYEQKKGTPMGSPLSGLIAEAVLQRLERLVFRSYSPKFWARYVDDTFVVIKRNDVQDFKVLLNSIFPDIQFTMEEENNNQLPFLDVNVARTVSGRIRTTVYRKATNTRRILQFRSNHPIGHKRSCVRTLFQRVQTHCSDDDGKKEEAKYLHSLFTANGYPRSFIRECRRKTTRQRSVGEKPKFWLAIPYVKNVSEATARILNPFGIGVAHKPESTIRQQIMRPKDPLPATEQSAVVYSIPCQNCNARYVGETGKRLCTRLHEHQLAVNREDKLSLVYGHMQQEKHHSPLGKQASSVEPMTRWLGWCSKAGPQLAQSTGLLIFIRPTRRCVQGSSQSRRDRQYGQASRGSSNSCHLHSREKEPAAGHTTNARHRPTGAP